MSRFWTPWRPKPEKTVESVKPDIFGIAVKSRTTGADFLIAFSQAILEKFPDLLETKPLQDFNKRYKAAEKEIKNGKGK